MLPFDTSDERFPNPNELRHPELESTKPQSTLNGCATKLLNFAGSSTAAPRGLQLKTASVGVFAAAPCFLVAGIPLSSVRANEEC